MKTFKVTLFLSACLLPAIAAGSEISPKALQSAEPSAVWLNGDSTLHPYAATTTAVNVTDNLAGGLAEGAVLSSVAFAAPVETLHSGEKGLDKNMYKSLKSTANPDIRFESTGDAPVVKRGDAWHVSVPGRLTVSGTSKDITLEADLQAMEGGVVAVGRHDLLMSDYGVKPPVFLGVLKTRDAVTVGFSLTLVAGGNTP